MSTWKLYFTHKGSDSLQTRSTDLRSILKANNQQTPSIG